MRALLQSLKQSGIESNSVLAAIEVVPREQFVPEELKPYAYENEALPIDYGQTISQPFVIARMTELITEANHLDRVLEIGTGSGYQTAILSQIFDTVYSVERINDLLDDAKERFQKLGYSNIHTKFADGFEGWAEHAPYDAIIVTAAAEEIPPALLEQMSDGGRMIIPIQAASAGQRLQLVRRQGNDYDIETLDAVVFVPMLPGQQE